MRGVLVTLLERLNALEQRLAASNVVGKVTDVDAAKGLYRQTIGKDAEGNDVKSPWIPYSQPAGALKIHSPPSVGQQMALLSNGSIESGTGIPLSWSDANSSPNNKGDEHTITFRGVRIDLTDGLKIEVGGQVLEIKGGKINIIGGELKHDGKNIGKDHIHGGVEVGGATTTGPEA
jgi:phage baseplate assembly protein gpV